MQNRIIPIFTCPIIILLVVLFSLIIGLIKSTQAQETWDLSKCVNYALENNIDLNLASNKVDNILHSL